jgi:hypothetical protein
MRTNGAVTFWVMIIFTLVAFALSSCREDIPGPYDNFENIKLADITPPRVDTSLNGITVTEAIEYSGTAHTFTVRTKDGQLICHQIYDDSQGYQLKLGRVPKTDVYVLMELSPLHYCPFVYIWKPGGEVERHDIRVNYGLNFFYDNTDVKPYCIYAWTGEVKSPPDFFFRLPK